MATGEGGALICLSPFAFVLHISCLYFKLASSTSLGSGKACRSLCINQPGGTP